MRHLEARHNEEMQPFLKRRFGDCLSQQNLQHGRTAVILRRQPPFFQTNCQLPIKLNKSNVFNSKTSIYIQLVGAPFGMLINPVAHGIQPQPQAENDERPMPRFTAKTRKNCPYSCNTSSTWLKHSVPCSAFLQSFSFCCAFCKAVLTMRG